MQDLKNSHPEQPKDTTPLQAETSFLKKLKVNFPMTIAVAAGILVIFTAIIYAAYSYGKRGQKVQPTPAPTIVPTPLPTPLLTPISSPAVSETTPILITEDKYQTKDWEDYTSARHLSDMGINFSIRYPEGWFVSEEGTGTGTPWIIFSQNFVEGVTSKGSPCFTIGGGIWPDITLEKFIKEQDSHGMLLPSGEVVSPVIEVKSTRKILLGSYNGVERVVLKYGAQKETFQVFIKDGPNYTYGEDGVNFFIFKSCPDTKKEIFDQILSTFKVLD